MKTGSDRQLDKFSKRLFKESGIESPKADFTSGVISQIGELSENSILKYKPLISPKAWVLIIIAALSALSVGLMVSWEPVSWLRVLNRPYNFAWNLSQYLPEVELSTPLLYSAILFGVLLLFQIGYLSSYFNKKIGI